MGRESKAQDADVFHEPALDELPNWASRTLSVFDSRTEEGNALIGGVSSEAQFHYVCREDIIPFA